MNFDIIYNTTQIEDLAKKGFYIISEINSLIKEKCSNKLHETTDNGKIFNKKIFGKLHELNRINNTLKSYLNKENEVNIGTLTALIGGINIEKLSILYYLNYIFKDTNFDNEDKEIAHKYAAMYDSLVNKYENLLFKLSLKNINLRNKSELEIKKLNIKNNFKDEEIEKFMKELDKINDKKD